MALPPESIEVGKCYLCETGNDPRIRRVLQILPNGLVSFEQRTPRATYRKRAQYRDVFAAMVTREVPCDYVWEAPQERE